MFKNKIFLYNSYIMNADLLAKSLDNESNESIMEMTHMKIKQIKNDMLQKLQLSRDELKKMHQKLKNYRYVDDLTNIQYGRYIRWISLKNPENIKLVNGGIVCDIKLLKSGIHIFCKAMNRYLIQIKLDENLVFQKLTDQEEVILCAMDYLQK